MHIYTHVGCTIATTSPHCCQLSFMAQVFLLQCVAVCCSVLQCVAVCCSVLQYRCNQPPSLPTPLHDMAQVKNSTNKKKKFYNCCCRELHTFSSTFIYVRQLPFVAKVLCVCVCVCVCVYIYVCLSVCVCVCLRGCVSMSLCLCVSACLRVGMCVGVCGCICVCTEAYCILIENKKKSTHKVLELKKMIKHAKFKHNM